MQGDKPRRGGETFGDFFEGWMCEQKAYLEQLVTAADKHRQQDHYEEGVVVALIDRIVGHYEEYYEAKGAWERRDATGMLTPAWRSKLEGAFLWIGGWRPTLAIHLLYSKSGLQLEASLGDLIRGLTTGDLGELTPAQMKRIDHLHDATIRHERLLTDKLAKHQESLADRAMVHLSNAASQTQTVESDTRTTTTSPTTTSPTTTSPTTTSPTTTSPEAEIARQLDAKNEGMEELLHMADDLRLETLKAVIHILTPIQAVYFLIAAAQLHLRIHDWGKKRDLNAFHLP